MKRASGFTLIELIVALAIAAILLGLGAGPMQTFLANQKVTAVMNTVTSGISLARSSAVERRQPVGVCATINGTSCAGSTEWDTGWMVWADLDENGAFSAAGDEILRVSLAQDSGMTVTANISTLLYAASGLLSPMPGNIETIRICNPDASNDAVVRIMPSGQIISMREDSSC